MKSKSYVVVCPLPYTQGEVPTLSTGVAKKGLTRMTSACAIELASNVLEDPEKAVPLLRLLHASFAARGDPLQEGTMRDVMLFVYSKIEHCENSMMDFLSQEEDANQTPRAA